MLIALHVAFLTAGILAGTGFFDDKAPSEHTQATVSSFHSDS